MTQFGSHPCLGNPKFFPPAPPPVVRPIVRRPTRPLAPSLSKRIRRLRPPSEKRELVGSSRQIKVLAVAATMFGITIADIIGERKFEFLVKARIYVAVRLRSEYGMSLPQIGRMLGGRDHTTILYLLRRAQGLDRHGRPRQ